MRKAIALLLLVAFVRKEDTSLANQLFHAPLVYQHLNTGAGNQFRLLYDHTNSLHQLNSHRYNTVNSPLLYNFWSTLGHQNVHFQKPFQIQLVPLNPHYVDHQMQNSHYGSGQQNHESYLGDDVDGLSENEVLKSSESDHDTVVVQSDQAFSGDHIPPIPVSNLWATKDSSNRRAPVETIGFQRGQVESIPRPNDLEYVGGSGIPEVHQNGFHRGHVENSIGSQILRKTSDEMGTAIGFNRAAVEAPPTGANPAVPYYKATPENKVVCYFANWAYYRKGRAQYTPEKIDPNLCTHVIFAFATYDRFSLTIKETDPEIDVDKQLIQRVVALKQKNSNLKVLIAIGGWSDSEDDKYSKLANSLSNRRMFARESIAFLRKYGLDGISVDWHYPVCWQSDCAKGPPSDKYAFTELVKELRSVYSSEGLIVAASLSGYKEVIDAAYDIPKLSEYLDFMNIMTYDYHGSWESRTGHLSPLYEGPPSEDLKPTYNSNFTMEYYVSKGADRSKLILGVPFYGQSFRLENKFDHSLGSLADGPGNAGEFTQQPGMLSFYEICKRVKDMGWTVRKDTSGSWGPYAFQGDQWVGYDDVDSIRRKARHVTTHGFGGIFAFTLDLDDFNNDCCNGDQPLLRTISKELLGIPFTAKRSDCTVPTNPPVTGSTETPNPPIPVVNPTPWPTLPPSQASRACYYKTKPHPTDCNAYYVCHNEKEMLHKCPFGLHWNRNVETCDWPEGAGCRKQQMETSTSWDQTPVQTLPPRPTGSAERCSSGQFFDGPACDQYYLCSNGRKEIQTCGPGLHWNDKEKLCDWPNRANCKVRSEIGDEVFGEKCNEGEFTGTKRSCDMYYVCVHGRRVEFRCQGGLQWNEKGKYCDWPNNVKCTPSSQPITLPPTEEIPTESTTAFPTQVPWITQSPVVVSPTTSTIVTKPTTLKPPTEIVRPPSSPLSGDYKIVCYFTNWAWYRPGMGKYTPADINPDLCTHIVYGFAVLDYEQLLIKPHDTWADLDNKFYEHVVALKKKGKVVTIAIGGWNDSEGDKYSRLVNNPSARKRFIENVVQFLQKYNFDGLDLDWEYPKCWQVACDKGPDSDKPNFAAFVRELSGAFKPKGLLLSSAVSPSKTVIDAGYDVPTLSKYLDWIAVMTYDFHGQWDKKTGHVAPLYFHEEDDFYYFNVNYTMHYWIQKGADSRKLVMGIPLYGQSFTLVNPAENGLNAPTSAGGTAGEYTRASGFLAYYEICSKIQREGWTMVKDETGAMGPYAFKGNQWVSFDDVAMVRKKSELIRQLNLGGGMIWALDLDDFRNTCGEGESPLLTTIRSVLGRSKTIGHVTGIKKPQKSSVALPTETDELNVIGPIRGEEIEYCEEPFRGDAKDCNRYYQCIFGRYVEQRCPPGTVWNSNRCDWPGSSNCTSEISVKPNPKPTTTPTSRPNRPPVTVSPTFPTEQPVTQEPTSYRPPAITPSRFTTTPFPTKDPEWCRLNWCSTEKPLPENTHEMLNIPPSPYKVVCYFTNWAWYRQGIGKYTPTDIDFNLCTHIAYGFAVLDPTSLVIKPHDGWADIDNRFYKQTTLLRKRGVKVVLALGGWNDSLGGKYSKMANDPEARRRFIAHAIEFIETWDFDGLDLDWEYPKCWQVDCDKGPASDKQAFAALVRELKEAFLPRGLLLSAAVSPNKKVVDEGYDVPTVSKYLDWVAVMTYDYHGQWDKKTGHNAPMYHHPESDSPFFNANYSINYWISQGTDRRKIVMGMPMYGQGFTLVDPTNTGLNSKTSGGAQAGEFTRSAGFLAYYEICNYIRTKAWSVVQDQYGTMGPYAYKGNQWVSFDDVEMVRKKSEYIKEMGLGGGMIWALDLDDFRGICGCEKHPLLRTINRVLRNYPIPDPHCQLKATTY